MKKVYFLTGVFLLFSFILFAQPANNEWSEKKAKKWFKKKEYLQGLKATPHADINKKEFARQYHLNKEMWDKAFAFLKNTDLKKLSNGQHQIEGQNVYAIVTEAPTKDYDKTAFESHKNYIDLQYVITGEEKMGRTPVESLTVDRPYNERADIAYYKGDGKVYTVAENGFLLFFPGEAHRPNITPGGNKVVKKVVIKIRAAKE